MDTVKRGLKADMKLRDLKIESLKDSSSEDLVWAGLEYVRKEVVLLGGSGLRLIEKWKAAMEAGDLVLAGASAVRSAKLTERRQYYLDQGARLLKILSRKSGAPTIIRESLTRAKVYDPGRIVSNEERRVLEDEFTRALNQKTEV